MYTNSDTMRGADFFRSISERYKTALQQIKKVGLSPNSEKKLERRWNQKEAALLIGVKERQIQSVQSSLEKEGKLSSLHRNSATSRVTGYDLTQINQLRDHFGTQPWRDPDVDECLILAIQNFKGGVGKSVTCVDLGQNLASKGYRVLIIDMDSQGSSTSTFGYIPDEDIPEELTILPFYDNREKNIDFAIRPTNWEKLDLIPSNLQLYHLELSLAADISQRPASERLALFMELRSGIDGIKENYDVVLIDSPPALGLVSMNIMVAADAIIVPSPPAMYDFSSTGQFFEMGADVLENIAKDKEYKFVKVLATKAMVKPAVVEAMEAGEDIASLQDGINLNSHEQILSIQKKILGSDMFNSVFLQTKEVENAAANFRTVLEDRKPQSRALNIINNFCDEIESEIIKTWPSKRKELLQKGQVG